MGIKINCEICNADLTTSQCNDWKITLTVDHIPYGEGQTFDICVVPPLKLGTYTFCGRNCLIKFLETS